MCCSVNDVLREIGQCRRAVVSPGDLAAVQLWNQRLALPMHVYPVAVDSIVARAISAAGCAMVKLAAERAHRLGIVQGSGTKYDVQSTEYTALYPFEVAGGERLRSVIPGCRRARSSSKRNTDVADPGLCALPLGKPRQ